MAKHMVTCKFCGERFDAAVIPYVKPASNRYAHKSCADKLNAEKSKEELDKEALETYIKKLFGINKLTVKIERQIKDYHENKNYSYSGIHKTLKYFFEIKKNDLSKANGGIGIVPYVYDQAFTYWRAIWEAQQQNQEIEVTNYILPAREVHIKPP